MALPQAQSSVTNLIGGLRVNYGLPAPASLEDPGGKIAVLISAVNTLGANVSYLQTLVSAAFASGVTFSGLSTTTFSGTAAAISNFNAS